MTDSTNEVTAAWLIDELLNVLTEDVDRPEVWRLIEDLGRQSAALLPELTGLRQFGCSETTRRGLGAVHGVVLETMGHHEEARAVLEQEVERASQSPMINGALFWVTGKNRSLEGRICTAPFTRLDILESSSHLCCASYLGLSVGDPRSVSPEEVWNSEAATSIRRSILDSSYRYCNKIACPAIQAGELRSREELLAEDGWWGEVFEDGSGCLTRGPETVNLSYDRTCNLSCSSCRTGLFGLTGEPRRAMQQMQERSVMPMLRTAKTAMITGSGDPFASPLFRQLLHWIDDRTCPNLKLILTTNGALLTPQQWRRYPNLAGKVQEVRVSLDGATKETHELLRQGSRWELVRRNLDFIGELRARGEIAEFYLVFTVQRDNFRQMGEFVELGEQVGATTVYFRRMTNWGTFSSEEYADRAVFLSRHPLHAEFLERMQDERLRRPSVLLGDLAPFGRSPTSASTRDEAIVAKKAGGRAADRVLPASTDAVGHRSSFL